MDTPSLADLLSEAEAHPVSGWDFAWLGDRLITESPPWNYDRMLAEYATKSPDLLDIGTGGGERLALLAPLPRRTVAVEGWPPNVDVASDRLRPLGVTVVAVDPAPPNASQISGGARRWLPFAMHSFGLVASRHEAYIAGEVARILTPGGWFLTEQIGADHGDFAEALGHERPTHPPWDVGIALDQLAAAGLEPVASGEATEVTIFRDVGAFAWYLRAVPWAVEGFTIASHRPALERLHARISAGRPLRIGLPVFFVVARRPSG